MDDQKIINTYHGLSRIEDQFRVMKSDLETRPIYVRTKEHINAHILICLLSLIIIRIIQNKIVNYSKAEIGNKRTMGLSSARIQSSFKIEIPKKLFKKMDLHNIKTSIKII